MELTELLRQAQDAVDRGDYGVAAAACAHALASHPTCLSAHRMLGEAHLEQGEIEPAALHFDEALALDPLNIVSRLGLGVAAEDRQDLAAAYTHYLKAWELNPALDQVRDELVRLRKALGGDGRLHPTRSALASTFSRGGQLGRAANEWRAVVAADPTDGRARMAFAEALWRQGDEVAAGRVCREVLATAPRNARALAILADVERRRGGGRVSAEEYRLVDPAGETIVALTEGQIGNGPPRDLSFLVGPPVEVPEFDFAAWAESFAAEPAADAAAADPNGTFGYPGHGLPAPDLWDSIVRDVGGDHAAGTAGVVDDLAGDPLLAFDWGAEAAATAPAAAPVVDDFADFAALLGGGADSAPISPAPTAASGDDLLALFGDDPAGSTAPTDALASATSGLGWFDADSGANGDGLRAEADDRVLGSVAPPVSDGPSVDAVAGSPAPVAEPVTPDASANPFITADGGVDLTIGWDDLDRQLAAATPTGAGVADHLVAELGLGDIVPFDALGDEEAEWEPFTDDDFSEDVAAPAVSGVPDAGLAAVAVAPAADSVSDSSDWDAVVAAEPVAAADPVSLAPQAPIADLDIEQFLASGWDSVEDDLASAIPGQGASGYTEMLRNIDQEGVAPFESFAGDEAPFDILAKDDAVGDSLEFDDLLAVTSADATSDLFPVPGHADEPAIEVRAFPAQWAEPAYEPPLAMPAMGADDPFGDLAGLVPFAFDDGGAGSDRGAEPIDFADVEPSDFGRAAFDAVPGFGLDLDPDPIGGAQFELADADATRGAAVAWDPEPFVVAEAPERVAEAAEPTAGGESYAPEPWPLFVASVQDDADGLGAVGDLFARLRAQKAALVGEGTVVVDRALRHAAPVAADAVAEAVAEAPETMPGAALVRGEGPLVTANGVGSGLALGNRNNGLSLVARAEPSSGFDFPSLRERLKGGAEEAHAVVAVLEGAIGSSGDPLVSRVLGEAYLKLGRTEDAAVQFRHAMTRRARRR